MMVHGWQSATHASVAALSRQKHVCFRLRHYRGAHRVGTSTSMMGHPGLLQILAVDHPTRLVDVHACGRATMTTSRSDGPAAKIWRKAGMAHHGGRRTNTMAPRVCRSRKQTCFWPDNAATLAWVADVPSMHHHVGGRRAPADGCIAAALNLASLDQG